MDDVDDQIKEFYSIINSLIETHFPLRIASRNSNDKPWLTNRFRELISKRQQALASGKKDRSLLQTEESN